MPPKTSLVTHRQRAFGDGQRSHIWAGAISWSRTERPPRAQPVVGLTRRRRSQPQARRTWSETRSPVRFWYYSKCSQVLIRASPCEYLPKFLFVVQWKELQVAARESAGSIPTARTTLSFFALASCPRGLAHGIARSHGARPPDLHGPFRVHSVGVFLRSIPGPFRPACKGLEFTVYSGPGMPPIPRFSGSHGMQPCCLYPLP